MIWLVVPVVLVVGAASVVAAIRSVESARRTLQAEVAALVATRTTLEPVQRHISTTAAVARDRR